MRRIAKRKALSELHCCSSGRAFLNGFHFGDSGNVRSNGIHFTNPAGFLAGIGGFQFLNVAGNKVHQEVVRNNGKKRGNEFFCNADGLGIPAGNILFRNEVMKRG